MHNGRNSFHPGPPVIEHDDWSAEPKRKPVTKATRWNFRPESDYSRRSQQRRAWLESNLVSLQHTAAAIQTGSLQDVEASLKRATFMDPGFGRRTKAPLLRFGQRTDDDGGKPLVLIENTLQLKSLQKQVVDKDTMMKMLVEQVDNQREEMLQLDNEVLTLTTKNRDLKEMLKNCQLTMKHNEDAIKQAGLKEKDATEKQRALRNHTNHLKAELFKVNDRSKERNSVILSLEQENRKLFSDIDKLKAEIQNKIGIINRANKEVDKQRADMTALREENEKLRNKVKSLEAKLADSVINDRKQKDYIANIKNEIDHLSDSKNKSEAEREDLFSAYHDLRRKKETLEEEYNTKADAMKDSVRTIEMELERSRAHNTVLQQKLDMTSQEREEIDHNFDQLRHERDELEAALNSNHESIRQKNQSHEDVIDRYIQLIKKQRMEIYNLEQDCTRLEDALRKQDLGDVRHQNNNREVDPNHGRLLRPIDNAAQSPQLDTYFGHQFY